MSRFVSGWQKTSYNTQSGSAFGASGGTFCWRAEPVSPPGDCRDVVQLALPQSSDLSQSEVGKLPPRPRHPPPPEPLMALSRGPGSACALSGHLLCLCLLVPSDSGTFSLLRTLLGSGCPFLCKDQAPPVHFKISLWSLLAGRLSKGMGVYHLPWRWFVSFFQQFVRQF